MQSAMKSPTPAPTTARSTVFSMCGTVSASTCRSGSATVMAKPRRNDTPRISGRFFVLVSAVPIRLPMSVIDCSAPREKSPMPAVRSSAPMRNVSSRSVRIGTMQRHSITTMQRIGSTDAADSRIFSPSTVRVFSMAERLIFFGFCTRTESPLQYKCRKSIRESR